MSNGNHVSHDGKYATLNDGHRMPLVGLGCWQASEDEISSAVCTALEGGYRLVDTAYTYFNEKGVGAGLRRWGGDRGDVFVVTKLPPNGMGGGMVEHFLRQSLENLGLDHVDLYLIHNPIGLKYISDTETFPMDDSGQNLQVDFGTNHIAIWKEMEEVKKLGLAKSIGVSNYSMCQLRRLLHSCSVPPAVNQVEMHVQFQQRDMQKFCRAEGIRLMSFGTLGSPGRTGTRFEEGCTIPSLLQHPVVGVVASLNQATPAQVLLRFFVQQGVVVIPKSTNPQRQAANLKVLDISLSDQSIEALKTLERGEEARSFNFMKRRGMQLHPECPAPYVPEFCP